MAAPVIHTLQDLPYHTYTSNRKTSSSFLRSYPVPDSDSHHRLRTQAQFRQPSASRHIHAERTVRIRNLISHALRIITSSVIKNSSLLASQSFATAYHSVKGLPLGYSCVFEYLLPYQLRTPNSLPVKISHYWYRSIAQSICQPFPLRSPAPTVTCLFYIKPDLPT